MNRTVVDVESPQQERHDADQRRGGAGKEVDAAPRPRDRHPARRQRPQPLHRARGNVSALGHEKHLAAPMTSPNPSAQLM